MVFISPDFLHKYMPYDQDPQRRQRQAVTSGAILGLSQLIINGELDTSKLDVIAAVPQSIKEVAEAALFLSGEVVANSGIEPPRLYDITLVQATIDELRLQLPADALPPGVWD